MLLQRKIGKESRHKGPALRSRSLMYPPEVFLAVALLEAQRLPTIAIYHNACHIKRKTFLGGGLFSVHLACQLKGKELSLNKKILSWRTDRMGLRTEVILWEG